MTHWAMGYLGHPWRSGESGPDAFDCYGLVRAIYRDRLGVELPVIDTDAARPLAARRAMRDYPGYADWLAVEGERAELDVIQMGHARHPHHVGVWVDADGGGVLHCVEGAGVVFQRAASLALHGWHVLNVYRRAAA